MTKQNTFAFDELQQKANEGDAQAQFDLALCYACGTGSKYTPDSIKQYDYANIEENAEFALNWHKKAAEQGHVDAQFGHPSFLALHFYNLQI